MTLAYVFSCFGAETGPGLGEDVLETFFSKDLELFSGFDADVSIKHTTCPTATHLQPLP